MSRCEELRIEIPALLGGELARSDKARLQAHLVTCAGCRRELQELREVVSMLAPAPLSERPRAHLESEVMGLIEPEEDAGASHGAKKRRELSSPVRRVLVPVLAAGVVALGFLAWQSRNEADDLRNEIQMQAGSTVEEIEFVSATGASGNGELRETPDGNYRLIVWADGLEETEPGEYYGMWLSGDKGWLAAGSFKVRDHTGEITWDCPVGVDPSSYSKVWITLEPDDGDPRRSGPEIMQASLDL